MKFVSGCDMDQEAPEVTIRFDRFTTVMIARLI